MENVKWLHNAKLRLGWGLVGNQQAGSYAYGSTLKPITTAWGTGFLPSNVGNPDLTWESTKAWNIGLDLNLFSRIEIIIDAYLRQSVGEVPAVDTLYGRRRAVEFDEFVAVDAQCESCAPVEVFRLDVL